MKNNHYVYKITNDNPVDGRRYYIGVRTSKDCAPEEDTQYWGSCKSLTAHMEELGLENFRKEILRKFPTRKAAVNYEIELHDRYDVSRNEIFYNRSKQKVNGFDRAGVEDSPEERTLKSQRAKMVMETRPELKEKFANNHGKNNPFYGKFHSEETKKKIGEASRRRNAAENFKKNPANMDGKDNPRAIKIEIYNHKEELVEIFHGDFWTRGKSRNWPYAAFMKSYRNNGEKLYQTNQGKSRAKYFGFEKYIGWSAKKIDKSEELKLA